jgi:metal-responsive CopG/Arc/MetJ family transcriptional regulator
MNNPTKEKMVSFLLPTQILESINDIRLNEGQSSRSSVIRKLVNSGLKNYYQYLENNNLVNKQ